MARRRHHRKHHRRHHKAHRRTSAHQRKLGAKGRKAFDHCLKQVGSGAVSATRAGWAGCFRKVFRSRG